MKYLSRENILQIHSMAIDETGGIHGIHNHDAILSLEFALRIVNERLELDAIADWFRSRSQKIK